MGTRIRYKLKEFMVCNFDYDEPLSKCGFANGNCSVDNF